MSNKSIRELNPKFSTLILSRNEGIDLIKRNPNWMHNQPQSTSKELIALIIILIALLSMFI